MQPISVHPRTSATLRRSASQWQTLVDAQAQSGLSQRAYCEREDLPLSSFSYWRRKLNGNTTATPFVELPGKAQAPAEPDWQVELALGEHLVLRIRQR